MLNRQIVYFISKYGRLTKFTAEEFLHCSTKKGPIGPQAALFDAIRDRAKASFHDSP